MTPDTLPTATPSATATATATPSGFFISGHIRYYSNEAPVNDAVVERQGAGDDSAQSDASGSYLLPDMGGGTWSISPHKSGDSLQGISSLDAAYALQASAGLRVLSPTEKLACDVTGNGAVSAFDAALILQLKVDLISSFPVAQACASDWAFVPVPAQGAIEPDTTVQPCQPGAIVFDPLTGPAEDQDFHGVAFGDCTGNWQPAGGGGGASGGSRTLAEAQLRLGRLRHGGGRRLLQPLYVSGDVPFEAFDAEVRYESADLQVRRVRLMGAARRGLLQFNARVPGIVRIAFASASPIDSGGEPVAVVEFIPPARARARIGIELHRR